MHSNSQPQDSATWCCICSWWQRIASEFRRIRFPPLWRCHWLESCSTTLRHDANNGGWALKLKWATLLVNIYGGIVYLRRWYTTQARSLRFSATTKTPQDLWIKNQCLRELRATLDPTEWMEWRARLETTPFFFCVLSSSNCRLRARSVLVGWCSLVDIISLSVCSLPH